MTHDPSTRHWHGVYESSSPAIREAIDDACQEAIRYLQSYGLPAHAGDPVECLAAALMRYVAESSESPVITGRIVTAESVSLDIPHLPGCPAPDGFTCHCEDIILQCPVCKAMTDDNGRCACDLLEIAGRAC